MDLEELRNLVPNMHKIPADMCAADVAQRWLDFGETITFPFNIYRDEEQTKLFVTIQEHEWPIAVERVVKRAYRLGKNAPWDIVTIMPEHPNHESKWPDGKPKLSTLYYFGSAWMQERGTSRFRPQGRPKKTWRSRVNELVEAVAEIERAANSEPTEATRAAFKKARSICINAADHASLEADIMLNQEASNDQ